LGPGERRAGGGGEGEDGAAVERAGHGGEAPGCGRNDRESFTHRYRSV